MRGTFSSIIMASQQQYTVGYFNPNEWPVQIVHSGKNLRLTLASKGDYIIDGGGRKINDPFLERYVGAGMLAREISAAPVPIIPLDVLLRPAPVSHVGFSGTTEPARDPGGEPYIAKPAKIPHPGNPHATPIMGCSIEEARRLGLVRSGPPRDRDEGITETKEGLAPELFKGLPSPKLSPQRDELEDEMEDGVSGTISIPPALREALDDPIAATVVESFKGVSAGRPGLPTPVLRDEISLAPPAPPAPPVVVPPVVVPPVLDSGQKEAELKFVCPYDGKKFQYRSMLKRHLERKYPTKVDEVLATYPEKR